MDRNEIWFGARSELFFVESLRFLTMASTHGIRLKLRENVAEMLQGKKDLR